MIKFNRQFDPQAIKLLIFDLDGTLIDSRLDLVHSVNAMLRHFNRPELPAEVIATYVGDGAPMLVQRALGDPRDHAYLKKALDYFLAYYRAHKLDHTHVYEGVTQALATLRQSRNGMPRQMAVLSNKPVHPSRAIVEACESMPPTSTMTPAASVNSGVQDGSVAGATRIAPRFIRANSLGSRITTTSASTLPGLTHNPESSPPPALAIVGEERSSASRSRARMNSGISSAISASPPSSGSSSGFGGGSSGGGGGGGGGGSW